MSSVENRHRGSILVETAMVTGFMIMLLSGAIDCGLSLNERSVLLGAARSSARAGARQSGLSGAATTPAEIGDAVNAMADSMMTAAGLKRSNYLVVVEGVDIPLPSQEDKTATGIKVTIKNKSGGVFRILGSMGIRAEGSTFAKLEGDLYLDPFTLEY